MNQPPQIHEPRGRPTKLTGQAPAFGEHDLTESVAARVHDILASAHETAEGVREQVAVATRDMLAQAQATVDRDTERIRRDVEARAAQYLAECHRRVDAFADARVRRLRELSDSLIEQTDALHGRFTQVVRLSEQLDALLGALGGAAEQTAREVKRPAISLPTMAQFHGESNGEPRDRSAVPPASTDDGEAPIEAGVPEASAATDLATASTERASAEATSTDAASTAAPGTQGRSDPATGDGADGGESR